MNQVYDAVIGAVIGDALGVPMEEKSRDSFRITDMTGFGVHNQPPGTWSDDSSMMLATVDSIGQTKTVDAKDIMDRFVKWIKEGAYCANDAGVFDIGWTTRISINNYIRGIHISECGERGREDNGNGALMRILPVAFFQHSYEQLKEVVSLTHAHVLNVAACDCYIAFATRLLKKDSKQYALERAWEQVCFDVGIIPELKRIPKIQTVSRNEIKSSGYVVHTLEAALWSFLQTDNYKDCVLTAVNLGGDTDTVACVAGGLAGIYYGCNEETGIPKEWIDQIARKDWIHDLCAIAGETCKR